MIAKVRRSYPSIEMIVTFTDLPCLAYEQDANDHSAARSRLNQERFLSSHGKRFDVMRKIIIN